MNSLLVRMSRSAINNSYSAQQHALWHLRISGHVVPKLNSPKAVFHDFFLTTLNSHNEYEQARLGVDTDTLEAQHGTALWSSTDDHDNPLDSGEYVLSETAKACLDYDFLTFVFKVLVKLGDTLGDIYDITGQDSEQVAHDFWLTRNGHGAGFWDGDYVQDALGDALTILAEEFGECHFYVGKDNLVDIY